MRCMDIDWGTPMFLLLMTFEDGDDQKTILLKIYEDEGGMLHHVALQVVENETDAEDLVQDLFLKLVRNPKIIKERSRKALQAYLFVMIRNAAIDMLRRQGRELPLKDEHLEILLDQAAASENVENDEDPMIEQVIEAYQMLPEKYRTVCSLKYTQGMENRQIAKELSLTEATVRKRLERARYKMESYINEKMEREQ